MSDDDLTPDIRHFQQSLAAAYAAYPPLDSVSLPQARNVAEAVRAPFAQGGPKMARTENMTLDTAPHGPLRLRLYWPSTETDLSALVYLHGGGWVFFSIQTHDRLMREIAMRTGHVVLGVDYSRAPESQFPVALEQTVAAWRWAQARASSLGLNAKRIALGGDSAGANLALAAALVLRDSGAMPNALLLNYGVYSDDDSGESFTRYDGPKYTLGREEMRSFWRHYLGNEADHNNPLAMPMKAALHGLPRCCLVVAECDILRDSSLAMAERLRAASVPLQLQRHAGATHSFLEAMSFSATANRALDQSCAWLRDGVSS